MNAGNMAGACGTGDDEVRRRHCPIVRFRRLFPVFAAVCAIGAMGLGWMMGRGQSLWFDEQYSLILASRPVRELVALTAVDAHPPLYYLLLKAWMMMVGDDVSLMRLLGCLFLGGTVLVSLVMMRDLFGERFAARCAPFLLCGGFMLRYGYELRMYSMAMFIVVFGTYALLRATGTIAGGGTAAATIAGDGTAVATAGIPVATSGAGTGNADGASCGASSGGDEVGPARCRDTGDTNDAARTGERPRRIPAYGWWAAYALAVALGMTTLYLTAFVWLAHAVWLVLTAAVRGGADGFDGHNGFDAFDDRRSGDADGSDHSGNAGGDSGGSDHSRRRGWRWIWGYIWRWRRLGVYAVSIVFYLPWMPVMFGQMRQSVFPPVRRAMNASAVANAFDIVVLGMTEKELPSVASLALLALTLSIVVLLTARSTAGESMASATATSPETTASAGTTENPPRRRRDTATLIIMSFAVPLVCMIVWSAVRELTNGGYGFFSVRYLSVITPFLYMTLALACVPVSPATTASASMFLPNATTGTAPHAVGAPGIRRDGAERRRPTSRVSEMPDAPTTYGMPERPRSIPRSACPAHPGRVIRLVATAATLLALVTGTVVFGVRGNHSFDRDDTPGSAALSRQVVCSAAHPVVAQDEYTYIDAYRYYRDCPAYYFLDADDVPTRGGYVPLRGSDAQLRSIDDLDADGFTLLSWSTTRDYDRLLGSDEWTRTGVLKHEANAAVTYRAYRAR